MSDIYNGTKTAFLGTGVYANSINVETDTLGVFLGSDDTSYTFSPTDGDYVADIFDAGTTATEFTGAYTPQTLTTVTIEEDNTNDRAEVHADNVTFTAIDGDTIQFALIAKQVGTDWSTPADDPLVAFLTSSDFPLPTSGGDVTFNWGAEGIVHIK